jgi:hypothetical protein
VDEELRDMCGEIHGECARYVFPNIIIYLDIYISLQLCKTTDARASHINAKQGTIKAQNTIRIGQLNKAIKCPTDGVVGCLVQRMSQGFPWML